MLKKGFQSLRHLSTLQDINQEIAEFEIIWPFSKIKGEVKIISQATLTMGKGVGLGYCDL